MTDLSDYIISKEPPITLTRYGEVDTLFKIACYEVVNNPNISPESYENLLPNPIKKHIKPIHKMIISHRDSLQWRISNLERKSKWKWRIDRVILSERFNTDSSDYDNNVSINNLSECSIMEPRYFFYVPVTDIKKQYCKLVDSKRFMNLKLDKIHKLWRYLSCKCPDPLYRPCQLSTCGHVFCNGCIYWWPVHRCPVCHDHRPFKKSDILCHKNKSPSKLAFFKFTVTSEKIIF